MSGPRVASYTADAGTLHGLEPPTEGGRTLWHLVPTGAAIVLGSTQEESAVDVPAATAAGVAVVKRRSGGGAVWVDTSDPIWIDVWIPRHDRAWSDDVARAFTPIGEAWIAALDALGLPGLVSHRGAMVCHPGSRQVCFAGVGPGEVLTPDGVKVVGLSQRRSRAGARFQCSLYRRWDPEPLHRFLVDPPDLPVLRSRAVGIEELGLSDVSDADVVAALATALA